MKLCDKLQILRRRQNLTQEEFANQLGVTRQTVSKWESDTAYPDLEKMQTLCKLFHTDVDALLNPNVAEDGLEATSCEPIDLSGLSVNIKKYRMEKNIPQEVFAEMLGVSRQSVSKWESGQVLPKTELLIAMIDLLEVKLGDLFAPVADCFEAEADPLSDSMEDTVEDIPAQAEDGSDLTVAMQCDAARSLDESAEVTEVEIAPVKPQRPKKWLKWVIIPVASLLALALAFAAVLFIPFIGSDPVKNTVESIFSYGLPDFEAMDAQMTKDGVQVTLEAGGKPLSMTLRLQDAYIAISGLSDKGGDDVLLPRKDIRRAMERSVFSPQCNSIFSMTQEEFDGFVGFLESFASDHPSITDTYQKIADALEEHANVKVSYAWSGGGFGLEQTVSCRFNKKRMVDALNDIISIAKEDTRFDEMFSFDLGYEDLALTDDEAGEQTLSQMLASLRDTMETRMQDFSLIASYTVYQRRISGMLISLRISDSDGSITDIDLSADLLYDDTDAKMIWSVDYETRVDLDGSPYTTKVSFSGAVNKTETKERLLITTQSTIGIKATYQDQVSTDTIEGNGKFEYDRVAHTYFFKSDNVELGLDIELSGAWQVDEENCLIRFSLDSVKSGGEAVDEAFPGFAMSAQACPAGTAFPDNAPVLHEMTEQQMVDYIRGFSLDKICEFVSALTGEEMDISQTKDGKPLLFEEALRAKADELVGLFYEYRDGDLVADAAPVYRIFYYCEGYDTYIIARFTAVSDINNIYFYYDLTEELLEEYHEARIVDGKLEIHKPVVLSYEAATCGKDGAATYKCQQCQKTYSIVYPMLAHSWEIGVELPVAQNDLGEEVRASVCKCKNCGALKNYTAGQFMLRFNDNRDGTRSLISYSPVSDTSGAYYFSIPEAHARLLNLTELDISLSEKFVFVRIPTPASTLYTGSFLNSEELQVLVLPSTLRTIVSGAFGNLDSLHTVFFEGTEEQWNSMMQSEYRSIFASKTVIFAPEGVTSEMVLGRIIQEELVEQKVEELREKVISNKMTPEWFAQDCDLATTLYIPEGAKIYWVDYDEPKNRIVVSATLQGTPWIYCYDATTYQRTCSFSPTTPIGNNHSAWDGYLALVDSGNSFSLYNTDTGEAIDIYIWLPETAYEIFVIDGKVWVGNFYLAGSANVTVYDIATGRSTELLELYQYTNARFYINRELHRFIILCDSSVSMYVVGVYDTQTMGHVNDLVSQHEIYDWCIEWGYVALWRYEAWNYLDLRDLVVKEAAGVNIPTLTPSLADNEFVHTEFVNATQLSLNLCYTNNGDVFTTVTTKEGEVRLSYYAERGILLANGDVLIYTPDGYGVLIIDVPNGK